MAFFGKRSGVTRRFWLVRSAILSSAAVAAPVWAQTASQITPPSYAPPPMEAQPPIIIPESAATAPPGSEALEVTLTDIVIEGVTSDPELSADLRRQLTGRPVKVAEIFAAARALETRHARAGAILTRVVVPAQQLADGATLRLVVIEGFIERVDTSQLPSHVRGRIARLLAPLQGAQRLTMAEIERRLLLAAEVPGTALRSALAQGREPGGAILVIAADHRPVTGFVSIDNMLPEALGHYSYGLALNFNSLLGQGETMYLRASGLPNTGRETSFLDPTPRNRALAGGLIAPIGDDGLALNIELTDARTTPRHDPRLPGVGSKFQRLSGRLRYPFVRSRALTFIGEVAFDAQSERVNIVTPVNLPLSLDRLRVLRLGGTLFASLPEGTRLSARLEASLGIDGLGARSASDATPLLPLSRLGADADFRKVTLDLDLDQPLARHIAMTLSAHAQTSFGDALANAEQIGVANVEAISPLPSGEVQGDAGFVVRGELQAPLTIAFDGGAGRIAPYGFGAFGGVRLVRPTIFEQRDTSLHAYGVGMRLSAAAATDHPGISTGFEYGRAHREGAPAADRFSFSIMMHF